jgi:D-glycero-D-manno-heptose 1,7-bisphosphate phosphatase
MLLRAIEDFNIDPARSFMIGDQISDVLAGARAGVASYRIHGEDLVALVGQAIAELGVKGV